MASTRFKNKIVIITGANTKLGKEISVQFIIEGASVVLVGKNTEKLNRLKEICDEKKEAYTPPAFVITTDLTDDDEAKNVINQTIEKFGKLDILINNAEIVSNGSLIDGSILQTFDNVMNVNLRAAVAMTTFAAPHLIIAKGNIINVSSIGAERILRKDCIPYFLSKAGLNHFTRACAMELGCKGVRVNTVSIGDTSENNSHRNCMVSGIDLAEITELVLHAASDKSKGMTGSNLVNDSGYLVARFHRW